MAVNRLLMALIVTLLTTACVNGPRWEATMVRGKQERERGDYAAAERSLLDALAQADRLHRLHPYQLETNTELARLYFKTGEFAKAKETLTRLVGKLETLYREDHPSIGAMHGDLGRACDALGELDEASSHYAKALAVALQVPAQNAIDYLYLDMAVNAQRRGLNAEADALLTRAESAARILHPGGGPIFDEIRARRGR
jgi:tetratricopeptide (TPR) repeat protein